MKKEEKIYIQELEKDLEHRDLSFAYADLCKLYAEYIEFLVSILR